MENKELNDALEKEFGIDKIEYISLRKLNSNNRKGIWRNSDAFSRLVQANDTLNDALGESAKAWQDIEKGESGALNDEFAEKIAALNLALAAGELVDNIGDKDKFYAGIAYFCYGGVFKKVQKSLMLFFRPLC